MVSTNSMRATFVYQAYGPWHFAKQAVLAVLSLLRHGVPTDDVIVFTDVPEAFADLKVHILQATAATIKAWQRPYCHPHRLKIELIRHIFGSVRTPLVYLDSDTVWLNSPARVVQLLNDGASVMHDWEGSPTWLSDIHAVMQNEDLIKKAGLLFGPTAGAAMYNAGVLGLSRQLDPAVLDHGCRMCDFLSMHAPRQMTWAEQMTFSYLLQSAGRVETCKQDVLHYWRESFDFARQIQDFSRGQLFDLCQNQEQLDHLLAASRTVNGTFGNQILKCTKRFQRSLIKRKRILWAIAQRHRTANRDYGNCAAAG
jgi:hypothetical protein